MTGLFVGSLLIDKTERLSRSRAGGERRRWISRELSYQFLRLAGTREDKCLRFILDLIFLALINGSPSARGRRREGRGRRVKAGGAVRRSRCSVRLRFKGASFKSRPFPPRAVTSRPGELHRLTLEPLVTCSVVFRRVPGSTRSNSKRMICQRTTHHLFSSVYL